jgi:hypothetical protein
MGQSRPSEWVLLALHWTFIIIILISIIIIIIIIVIFSQPMPLRTRWRAYDLEEFNCCS